MVKESLALSRTLTGWDNLRKRGVIDTKRRAESQAHDSGFIYITGSMQLPSFGKWAVILAEGPSVVAVPMTNHISASGRPRNYFKER